MNSRDLAKLVRASEALLKTTVTDVEHPGGKSRRSIRIHLESGGTAIVTRRKTAQRAMLEARVLRMAGEEDCPVPRMLGFNGLVMVQEDLGDLRLSQALDGADESEVEALLESALDGLSRIHQAARRSGIDQSVPSIGKAEGWLMELIARPAAIGELLDIPSPHLETTDLLDRLTVRQPPGFVKWDARPGNALVREDRSVAWFDWEHCGRRNSLDDLAWLLCDEFVPLMPEVESRVLERHLQAFAGDADYHDPMGYFAAYGTFHCCVRLELILDYRGDGDWWDWSRCLKGDKAGVTLEAASRLCRRAARLADNDELTKTLVDWFAAVEEALSSET